MRGGKGNAMKIQDNTTLPQLETNRLFSGSASSGVAAAGAAGIESLTPFQPAQGNEQADPSLLAPFRASGLSADRVEVSSEAKQKLADEVFSNEVAKKVAEQFSGVGQPIGNDGPTDFSPEAAAGRIARIATGLFEAWQADRPEGAGTQGLASFEEKVFAGARKGFRETLDRLQEAGADEDTLSRFRDSVRSLSTKLELVFRDYRDDADGDDGNQGPQTASTSKRPSLDLLEA